MAGLRRVLGSAIATVAAGLALVDAQEKQPPSATDVNPNQAMWHIGLSEMFGKNPPVIVESRGDYNLNVYAVFKDGKFDRGLGSAKRFNKSVHIVEDAGLNFDGKSKLVGKLRILLTPDQWVPTSHQPVVMDVDVDGSIAPGTDAKKRKAYVLTGTWKAVMHGGREGPGADQTFQGALSGGVEPQTAAPADATYMVQLNPVPPPGDPAEAMIEVRLGLADGRVQRGGIGVTWRDSGAWRQYPLDPAGLAFDGAVVTGKCSIPYRAIDIACDPKATCEVDLRILSVQGLLAGKARVAPTLNGKAVRPAYLAYGRGQIQPGGGRPNPAAPQPIWARNVNLDPWWAPVAGFRPVGPGEHPRLVFRKDDVPALRRKMETPEGKAILARLRLLLDGKNGDSFPTLFNTTAPNNHDQTPDMPAGAFTTWHGAGYGFLYQLTGEAKYADLARQAVQACFDGKIDVDNRYAWFQPGTVMRAGSILAGVSYAYDFCYDAWPEDFRRKVALEIQNYDKHMAPGDDGKPTPDTVNMERLATCKGYPPGSNHYGSYLGVGVAILTLLGDAGTDTAKLERNLTFAEANLVRLLNEGFGDRGFYPEGHHPPRLSANGGMLEFVVALRNAAGRDYVTAQPNTEWVTLRWLMETFPGTEFMHRGVYGDDHMGSGGLSHDGEIANGFATISNRYKPAWLWFHDHFFKPSYPNWGAATYPHRAVYSFVFWPVGTPPANPETVMPRTAADTLHGYFYHRNRWKDEKDIVVTHCLDIGPKGYYGLEGGGKYELNTYVRGLGLRTPFPGAMGTPVFYETAPDGSSVLATAREKSIASMIVDLSGASGAQALLAAVRGEGRGGKDVGSAPGPTGKFTRIKAGDLEFVILTLQEGAPPSVAAEGDIVKVGGQSLRFDGTRIVPGVWKK